VGDFPNKATQFRSETQPEKNGRPKKLPELDKLLADVLGEDKDGIEAAKAILMALRSKATKGDVRAAEVLLDRAYGKSQQNVNVSGGLNLTWNEEKTYEADRKADESS
jgi:hypothetical protein